MVQFFDDQPADPQPLDQLLGYGKADATALIAREGAFTYAELNALTSNVAQGLLAAGARPGDRVASWMGKTLASAILPFACARVGLVHVPINPLLKPLQAAHILDDSQAVILVSQQARIDLITAIVQAGDVKASDVRDGNGQAGDMNAVGYQMLSLEDDWEKLSQAPEIKPHNQNHHSLIKADDLAALLYTSGSTGRPKGVMVSHANLWLGAESVAHYLGLTASDRVLALLPFSFDYGLNQMLSIFRAGGCVVLHDFLLPKMTIKALEKYQITVLAGVPPLWSQLIEHDWPDSVSNNLRVLTNSGGAMPQALTIALRQRCPAAQIFLMYGLTEAFRSTYLDPRLVDTMPHSIGKAIPHAEILIINTDGHETAAGEIGELVHCGPLVAQGYWQDRERTSERFRQAPAVSHYGGLAVWSGDQAMRDAQGFISFVGRNDEMIKTAGYRVSPTEVEEAALTSGAIRECAAFGIADLHLGQAIHLVATVGTGLGQSEAEDKLVAALKSSLPNFMQPSVVHWRTDLPRNPNGKLDRAALKASLSAH